MIGLHGEFVPVSVNSTNRNLFWMLCRFYVRRRNEVAFVVPENLGTTTMVLETEVSLHKN